MLSQIKETTRFLQNKTNIQPQIGMILGTGFGNFISEIDIETILPYSDIPNFPESTVDGHEGQLLFGRLNDVAIVVMQGRFHYYEGYDIKKCTFPVRVLKDLGISKLILTNASGGINTSYGIGDIMLVRDHINLLPDNPLRGKNISELGPRFPDMSEPYSKELNDLLLGVAEKENINIQQGTYAALPGPCYETKSEYKYLNFIGADAVGMSTVPEVIVARHMDLPCLAISIITNIGLDTKPLEVSHEEVQIIAQKSEPKITLLIKSFLAEMYTLTATNQL